MPGFFGVFGENARQAPLDRLIRMVDRFSLCSDALLTVADDVRLGVAYLRSAPLSGKRHFENERWTIVFSGDVTSVGSSGAVTEVPWDAVLSMIESGDCSGFAEWRGMYAVCAYDKSCRRVLLISDRRSQSPIFYIKHDAGFWVATDLSLFCRIPGLSMEFNPVWLYDFMFFSFTMMQETFLKGVHRMPPASVLEYSLDTREMSVTPYAEQFRRKESLVGGKEALELANQVFGSALHRLYTGAASVSHALSAGWDTRALLAFRPDDVPVTTYTYGVAGCEDMLNGATTAASLGLSHRQIRYDKEFVENLRTYLHDIVFLSGGLQGISRATLLHVYSRLTNHGRKSPLVIGGILGGEIFRGEGFVPSLISHDLAGIMRSGVPAISDDPWKRIWGTRYDEFRGHIESRLEELREAYGPFDDPAFHLSYVVYEMATKYFGGEMAVSSQFTTYRPAYLDEDILDYAYSSEFSTLTYSGFRRNAGWQGENNIMYANLITRNDPALAMRPAGGIPPAVLLKGEFSGLVYRLSQHYPRKIMQKVLRIGAPLEDWDNWLANALSDIMQDLSFSPASMVREYVSGDFLDDLRQSDPAGHFSRRIASAEIVLRLMHSGWERPTDTISTHPTRTTSIPVGRRLAHPKAPRASERS